MKIVIKHKRYLPAAAGKLLDHAGESRIFAFYGSLGAGKTTFIKAICELLGASDITSSPSFTLVNEYKTKTGESLYHIDFYRIKNISEVLDIGIEEYLYGGSYCFVEWPELAEEVLPEKTLKVHITVRKNEERIIEAD
ncbi:MAG: tRNA (adenosine(37)-N6)-threonylcarbamoyltransferase complex ATPase subunit type 1 TsaE [Bacteroidetes bacterium RBG_19FT_COMBO_42_10]|nr:MAG: tRNA (adenosine(37)-N6)-threonylcarbamoyltransferase complex ATPase subunit type 1 TsaE [Bacteroidetes bacterium RBG_19FT_COMBO_42_10]